MAAISCALVLAGTPVDATLTVSTTHASQIAVGQSDQSNGPAVPAPAPAPPPPAANPVPPVQPGSSDPAPDPGQGDIVVTGRQSNPPGDPFQTVNAKSFEATQAVDKALVGPVALAYEKGMPKPVRDGLRNFLGNLHEPVVFLSFLMQLKPGKAVETVGRFAINSTIGAAGLFDVAKHRPINLPRRVNGVADTLGYYGVKPGPFLFLPLIGPTTVRDLFGNGLDRLLLPLAVGGPFKRLSYTLPVGVLGALDRRANFDEQLHKIRDESADPYVAARRFYLERRQAEIDELRGRSSKIEHPYVSRH